MYSSVDFFMGKDKSFIAWIVTLIRPLNSESEDYIFKEGEEVFESIIFHSYLIYFIVYFMVKGTAAFVLPRLQNRPYKEIVTGVYFGHSELAIDKDFLDVKKKVKRANHSMGNLLRRSTVQAAENCDLLGLTLSDLLKMKLEFPEHFKEIADSAVKSLKSELMLKLSLIRIAEKEENKENLTGGHNMRSAFAVRLLEGLSKKLVKSKEASPMKEAYEFNPIETKLLSQHSIISKDPFNTS